MILAVVLAALVVTGTVLPGKWWHGRELRKFFKDYGQGEGRGVKGGC